MSNNVDPEQIAPLGAVCSRSMLFVSILNLSVILGNYLQHTTSAGDIFRYIFFLALKSTLYNTSPYNMDLEYNMVMLWLSNVVTTEFFQRNYKKMSFSYNFFVKLPHYNTIH